MVKKFSTFINEVYAGTGKAPGYNYPGKPIYNYTIQFAIATSLDIEEFKVTISEILNNMEVDNNDMSSEKLAENVYSVQFLINCYSEAEAASIFKHLAKELQRKYPFKFKIEDVVII